MKTLDEINVELARTNRILETVRARIHNVFPRFIELERERCKMLIDYPLSNVQTANAVEEIGEIISTLGEVIATQASLYSQSVDLINA